MHLPWNLTVSTFLGILQSISGLSIQLRNGMTSPKQTITPVLLGPVTSV